MGGTVSKLTIYYYLSISYANFMWVRVIDLMHKRHCDLL